MTEPMRPSVQIAPGIKLVRRRVFSAKLTETDWPQHMLTAIATARSMGAELFELEIIGMPKVQREAPQGVYGLSMMQRMLGYTSVVEGDEWKADGLTTPKEKQAPGELVIYTITAEVDNA